MMGEKRSDLRLLPVGSTCRYHLPMPHRVAPASDQIRDLEVLVRARHPLIGVETVEHERVTTLLQYVADRVGLPIYVWTASRGLVAAEGGVPLGGTESPLKCLEFIEQSRNQALYHLVDFAALMDGEPELQSKMRGLYQRYFEHHGAVVMSDAKLVLPPSLEPLFTHIELAAPSADAYYQFVNNVLRDLRQRMSVEIDLTPQQVAVLLDHMKGLTFFEVQKVITHAVVEDGKLAADDLDKVLDAKRQIIERSGVLSYYPAEEALTDIAGLGRLKDWLGKRKAVFARPEEAKRFGLTPPRGLLLLGVQGCGKSLSAKAVAREWRLPLLRLDPSNLYNKFMGESERNLKRAIATAEQMAPVVLWIDEIEKAFSSATGGGDSGTSQRIFGSFLTWLGEKKGSVFVIATANDISRLPAELLRKGRFDEIFFVDLPDFDVRQQIFDLHLRRRGRAGDQFDLHRLAESTQGFSGAEIEQVVISALYSAFNQHVDLSDELMLAEVSATRPLSETMSEQVNSLRRWAEDRAVPAD